VKLRSLLLLGAMGAVFSPPVKADDLVISGATTAPVSTSAAANSTPGDITIESPGSVTISTAGAAVTLDSDNAVSNAGKITNSVDIGGYGVVIQGNHTGTFVNSGNITIGGGNTSTSAAGAGVLLNGNGTFTGNITTNSGSRITVNGAASSGIIIETELNGSIISNGNIDVSGSSANGIQTTAPIDGAIVNGGTIQTLSGNSSTQILNVSPNPAVAIGANVLGGLLNAGPVNGSDPTLPAIIETTGSAPALSISPAIGSNAANVTIGILTDSTNPGYSLINRGAITATGDQPGVSSVAIHMGEAATDSSGRLTTFLGGFYNAGTVSAVATSDTAHATRATPAASDATAIDIGLGTTLPTLVNSAGGCISAATGGPLGGAAVALSIEAGGSLSSLDNAGTIAAAATAGNLSIASLPAYAIRDSSGTLNAITNSGAILATATELSFGGQRAVAADLSAATSAITFTDSGTVIGDIIFGSSTANQLTIEGPQASISGNIQSVGNGRVDTYISAGGTGGTLQTGSLKAGVFTVGPNGTVNFDVGGNPTVISATGAATFATGSHIELTPTSLLTVGTITLVHSDTGLSFGNYADTESTAVIPFLYDGNLSVDSQNLTLTLTRKSAAGLGLSGNEAAIYEAAVAATAQDSALASAFSELSDKGQIESALDQLLPVDSGIVRREAEFLTDPATNPIGNRQRELALGQGADTAPNVWGMALYDQFNSPGTRGSAKGGTLGFDVIKRSTGHFGLAITYTKGSTRQGGAQTANIDTAAYLISPYIGLQLQNFFLNGQFDAGGVTVATSRTVTIGTVSRVAQSNPSEILAAGGLDAGYTLHLGAVSLTPQIGVRGMELLSGSYTETQGGGGVNLRVSPGNQQAIRGFVGVSANGDFAFGDVHLLPRLLGGWNYTFSNTGTTMNTAFAVDTRTGFAVVGPDYGKSNLVGGAHLDLTVRNIAVSLGYDGSFSSNTQGQSALVEVSSWF
jgi:Autotransporter beta-domain